MDELRKRSRKINKICYSIDRSYYEYEKKLNITDVKLTLIYELGDGKFHSQKQICDDWNIPRTTLNTIVKQWEQDGYINLNLIYGEKREMAISLTEKGKVYAEPFRDYFYRAEDEAMKKVIDRFSDEFLEAMEYYDFCLKQEFKKQYEKCIRKGGGCDQNDIEK